MKLKLFRAVLCAMLLALALAAPACAGALELPKSETMARIRLSTDRAVFSYTAPVNSEYALCVYSAGGIMRARGAITRDGEVLASGEGEGEICSAWLVAGEEYEIQVSGRGDALIEIARQALSRTASRPLSIDVNAPQQKMIARAGDAHWYEFSTTENGALMLACVPEDENLSLRAMLFTESGQLSAEFENLPGGASLLYARAVQGGRYRLRVWATGGGTGFYTLKINQSASAIHNALTFSENEQRVAQGGQLRLDGALSGEALLWVSGNPAVASVNQDGVLTGVAPGETSVTVYGMNSRASCRITVEHIALESLSVLSNHIRLNVGDEAQIFPVFTPENASQRSLRYLTGDGSVASVSRDGVVLGTGEGETEITLLNSDTGLKAHVRVSVGPATRRYRALLVGEENYPFKPNGTRTGSANSVNAIAQLLGTVQFEDAVYQVRSETDLSRAELIAAIRESFSGAAAQDVSLLYITCHGSYSGDMSFLELSDGSTLSARDLERELRRIPGHIALFIDCCGSGGAIGASSDLSALAQGVTGAFSSAIRGSRYVVLCSAAADEDSYRLALNADAETGVMATVFARALCDGAGWNIDLNARGIMGADTDYDGEITMDELCVYMQKRVNWYLALAAQLTGEDYRQSVSMYPESSALTLFRRSPNA